MLFEIDPKVDCEDYFLSENVLYQHSLISESYEEKRKTRM